MVTQIILPEVEFISADPDTIIQELKEQYESITGRTIAQADPVMLFLKSIAYMFVAQRTRINDAAKQNLLAYARDAVLDHKGASWATPRNPATAATVTIEIRLSLASNTARIIQRGEQLTADANVFFTLDNDVVINPNETVVTATATCLTLGTKGNGYAIGSINQFINPIPFVSSVANITVSDGGAEVEDDDSYRERIRLAPEHLTVAGPEKAYKYHVQKTSALIGDVYVHSPIAGQVDIKFLMADGTLPTTEIIAAVENTVNASDVRPLTDYVTVSEPDLVPFDLDVTYYIDSQSIDANVIKTNIENAIEEWLVWQQSKIKRAINPSELIARCMQAGAKRVDVISPVYTVLYDGEVAHVEEQVVVFGGDGDE